MSVFSNIFKNNSMPSNILDMFPDAVLFITPDGDIYKANSKAEEIFKLSEKDLCRKNIAEIIENGVLTVESVLSTKKTQIGKAIVSQKELRYLELNASMNITSDSNKIIVTIRDVTDDYIQNADLFAELEEFKSSHIDKNNFLVNLANELQSPLHSAIGFSQALLENLGGQLSEKQQKYISIINKNNSELFSLITKIINLSRYEKTSIEVEFNHFDIIDFLNNVLILRREEAMTRNITFNVESEALQKRNCYTDSNLLKVAFNNILDLFLKNTSSDTLKIFVSTPSEAYLDEIGINKYGLYEAKSFVLFNFVASNFGVPFGEYSLLDNPYVQAERENKKFVETSLSFAIAQKISEFLRGTLTIEPSGIQGASVKLVVNLEQTETGLNGGSDI